jgi:hypothetical protein
MSFLSVQILGYLKYIALRQDSDSGRSGEDNLKLVRLRIEQYTVISRNLFILSLNDDVQADVIPAVHLSVPGHYWTTMRGAKGLITE